MSRCSLMVPGVGLGLLCLAVALPVGGRAAAGAGARPSPGDTTITLRLPADRVYPHAGSADSSVVFRHGSHVPLTGHDCTACHPRPFQMLRRGPVPNHRAMAVGNSCGACHDGRKAFGTRDRAACGACHSGAGASRMAADRPGSAAASRSKGPAPHLYPAGPDSPGRVTFRHATHLKGRACAACHPKPFAMAAAPPLRGGAMHAQAACGACHDGQRVFACTDAEACGRCHAGAGS